MVGETNVKMNDQHVTIMGQRKNLSPRQDSNLWPSKHRAGALFTWATENSWRARPIILGSSACQIWDNLEGTQKLVIRKNSHSCNFDQAYVVVQFYPWFKFYFPLFQIHYHTLPYPKTKENKI